MHSRSEATKDGPGRPQLAVGTRRGRCVAGLPIRPAARASVSTCPSLLCNLPCELAQSNHVLSAQRRARDRMDRRKREESRSLSATLTRKEFVELGQVPSWMLAKGPARRSGKPSKIRGSWVRQSSFVHFKRRHTVLPSRASRPERRSVGRRGGRQHNRGQRQ